MLKTTKNSKVSGKNLWKVSPNTGTTEKVPITVLKAEDSISRIDKKFRHRAALTLEKLLSKTVGTFQSIIDWQCRFACRSKGCRIPQT